MNYLSHKYENCAFLGYYAASSGKKITTTRRVTTQKSAVLIYIAAEALNHAQYRQAVN